MIEVDKSRSHKRETLISEYLQEAEGSHDPNDQLVQEILSHSNLEGLIPSRDVVLRTHEKNLINEVGNSDNCHKLISNEKRINGLIVA